MAQGQHGACCKVSESGGSSESLLRQCQRFLLPFSFVIGLGEGCSGTVVPQHSRQEVASSCEGAEARVTHSSCCGSVSCRNIWRVGRSLVSLSPTALLQQGICSFVSGYSAESSPRYCSTKAEGSGYPMPALKQSCSCGET